MSRTARIAALAAVVIAIGAALIWALDHRARHIEASEGWIEQFCAAGGMARYHERDHTLVRSTQGERSVRGGSLGVFDVGLTEYGGYPRAKWAAAAPDAPEVAADRAGLEAKFAAERAAPMRIMIPAELPAWRARLALAAARRAGHQKVWLLVGDPVTPAPPPPPDPAFADALKAELDAADGVVERQMKLADYIGEVIGACPRAAQFVEPLSRPDPFPCAAQAAVLTEMVATCNTTVSAEFLSMVAYMQASGHVILRELEVELVDAPAEWHARPTWADAFEDAVRDGTLPTG